MSDSTQNRRGFAGLILGGATQRLHITVVALGVGATACVDGGADSPAVSQIESASTVADYVGSSCSTSVVLGLSKQIADEIACEHPNGLTHFEASATLKVTSSSVLQYLEADAKADLIKVSQGTTVQVNSAFRTVVQQYLLYEWYLQGRCGIPIAAHPGTSNHESGRAVDLANYSTVIGTMGNHGWAHDVPGDDVHFDHTASPDIRGQDVKAFQVLWNANHPGDQIAEDGDYGPATESRIRQSPPTGFPNGPSCAPGTLGATVVAVNGPDEAKPQTRVHYSITLKNTGKTDWPATTKLQLAGGSTSSPLYDTSWASKTVVTTLGAPIAVGATGTVELDVMTPAETDATPVSEQLELNDGGTNFGDIELALTVSPNATDTSSDGGDRNDVGEVSGGCNAGGGGGAGGAILLALLAVTGRGRSRRAG